MRAHAALPSEVSGQLDGLTAGLADALGEGLVGVDLHGSLALGCFNTQRSDVDVLAGDRAPDQRTRAWSAPAAVPRSPGTPS